MNMNIAKCPLCGGDMHRRYYGLSCGACEFKCSEQDVVRVAMGMQAIADTIAMKAALLTIASGYEQRNIAPRMNGTHQSGPHLIDRKRMMEIARETVEFISA